jgi:endoglucanase
MSLSRRTLLTGAAALPLSSFTHSNAQSSPSQQTMLRGVSLAGADFGQLVPGQFDRDYTYPGLADFKFCAARGFNVVRLPFRWERLQPDLDKPFDAGEWAHIALAIDTAQHLGLSLILDPHNYARRRIRDDDYTVDHMIGSDAVPVAAFAAFWKDLSARTKDNPHVIYGLMNEPADIDAAAWLDFVNQTIPAIRDTGARNLVLVPGVAYTGAHSWYAAGNMALEGIRDPEDNFAVEVHQYLDRNSSGSSGAVVSETIGAERLRAFQTWAREKKLKAFLGEFGSGPEPVALKALENIVREVEANRDVWIGWTAWAAGPWWPDSEPLRLSPDSTGKIPPQTKLLSGFARITP